MKRNIWNRVAVGIAVTAVALAAIIPRQEIAHTEPEPGGVSQTLYDWLIVTRVTVLVVGLGIAGMLWFLGRRRSQGPTA